LEFAMHPVASHESKASFSGLAKCGVCGGSVSAESKKWGSKVVRIYCCKKHRQSGAAACMNNARRPVSSVNETLLSWIQKRILTEELITQAMKEIRTRLAARSRSSNQELPALEKQARKLRAEIERLGESLLASDAKPAVIVKMISAREAELHKVEARIAMAKVAPSVLDLETRRLEKEAKARLADVRALLAGSPEDARRALETLLDGPLTVTPLATDDGARFRLTGRVVLGKLDLVEGTGGTPDLVYRRGRPQGDSNPC
jgi:site-specific DNA recombinase